jgi:hypothetical protein
MRRVASGPSRVCPHITFVCYLMGIQVNHKALKLFIGLYQQRQVKDLVVLRHCFCLHDCYILVSGICEQLGAICV